MTIPSTLVALLALGLAPPDDAPPPQPPADAFRPDPAWKPLGTDLWFDPAARRLVLRARVALRDGPLEHLLCLRQTKEHESILATEADPRLIHAGLLLTGAEPGHPVRFRPQFEPPTGTPIAIDLAWTRDGQPHQANARDWIKEERSGRPLDKDWVFAGSVQFVDPETKATLYAAQDGDLITVANFPSAIIDLPFASSSSDVDRIYVADTPDIPPRGTPVTLYLHPATATPKPR